MKKIIIVISVCISLMVVYMITNNRVSKENKNRLILDKNISTNLISDENYPEDETVGKNNTVLFYQDTNISFDERIAEYMNLIGMTMFMNLGMDPESIDLSKYRKGQELSINNFINDPNHILSVDKLIPYFNEDDILSHVVYLKKGGEGQYVPYTHSNMLGLKAREYPVVKIYNAENRINQKYPEKSFSVVEGFYSAPGLGVSYLFQDESGEYYFVNIVSGNIHSLSMLIKDNEERELQLKKEEEEAKKLERKLNNLQVIYFNDDGTVYFDDEEYLRLTNNDPELKRAAEDSGGFDRESADVVNELIKRGCKITLETTKTDYTPECVTKKELDEIVKDIYDKYNNDSDDFSGIEVDAQLEINKVF